MINALARTAFAVLALSVGMGVYAADKKGRDDGAASRGDKEFVQKALEDGATEVELGKLAQSKGSSDAVKKFGQQMEADHSKAGEELKGIAGKVGALPKKEGPKQKAVKDLSNKSAKRFDHEYAEMMVDMHQKAVKLFRKQADKGENAELKQFASNTLPKLEEHLKMARDLKKQADKKS